MESTGGKNGHHGPKCPPSSHMAISPTAQCGDVGQEHWTEAPLKHEMSGGQQEYCKAE